MSGYAFARWWALFSWSCVVLSVSCCNLGILLSFGTWTAYQKLYVQQFHSTFNLHISIILLSLSYQYLVLTIHGDLHLSSYMMEWRCAGWYAVNMHVAYCWSWYNLCCLRCWWWWLMRWWLMRWWHCSCLHHLLSAPIMLTSKIPMI